MYAGVNKHYGLFIKCLNKSFHNSLEKYEKNKSETNSTTLKKNIPIHSKHVKTTQSDSCYCN